MFTLASHCQIMIFMGLSPIYRAQRPDAHQETDAAARRGANRLRITRFPLPPQAPRLPGPGGKPPPPPPSPTRSLQTPPTLRRLRRRISLPGTAGRVRSRSSAAPRPVARGALRRAISPSWGWCTTGTVAGCRPSPWRSPAPSPPSPSSSG